MNRSQYILSLFEATHADDTEAPGIGRGTATYLAPQVGPKGKKVVSTAGFFPHPFLRHHYVKKGTGEIVLSRKE